ncbi:MAG: S8 family serine peptidase [Oligoflexia bacterium]|nr:S8 family serine peptidase [Oligoflexia bacterium]
MRDYRLRWIGSDNDPEPTSDIYGHGTAQLACLLSIAPDVEVFAIKCTEVDPTTAIKRALELGVDIISCAWGFDIDQPTTNAKAKKLPRDFKPLHALIQQTVNTGVCVVAAAGNGQRSFPGCMPEVISAGGAYYGADRNFHPSDLSSVYESAIFPGRKIPDICGLTGNLPHGRLLLLPVPPKAQLAKRRGFKAAEGWALLSGTSAATAMIAGAAALVLQCKPGLPPADVRALLMQSSKHVEDRQVLDLKECFRDYTRITSDDRQGAPA